MPTTCTHLDQVAEVTPSSSGGGQPVHLRPCRAGACLGYGDDSPDGHTTAKPTISSNEPGEDSWYCYLDDAAFLLDGAPSTSNT